MWDVGQYERFKEERARPFFDLLARIPDRNYKRIADLGCGTGELTGVLAEHWPQARVVGVDQSKEMLEAAGSKDWAATIRFVTGDISTWKPDETPDLLVSNSVFQWIPDQSALLRHVVSYLAPAGVLAVQIPDNFHSPSHTLLHEVESDGPWTEPLKNRRRHDGLLSLAQYADTLRSAGFKVDAFEITYHHLLSGEDAVLEWMKGTALRPILTGLDDAMRADFLAAYGARLRAAYPATSMGTVFPFRRIFFVAERT